MLRTRPSRELICCCRFSISSRISLKSSASCLIMSAWSHFFRQNILKWVCVGIARFVFARALVYTSGYTCVVCQGSGLRASSLLAHLPQCAASISYDRTASCETAISPITASQSSHFIALFIKIGILPAFYIYLSIYLSIYQYNIRIFYKLLKRKL